MPTDPGTEAPTAEQAVAAATQRVGELFVGVCFALDDLDVAANANQALRALEALLA